MSKIIQLGKTNTAAYEASHAFFHTRFCYLDLQIDEEIFANAWDKQILIRCMEAAKVQFQLTLHAFCVLDDSVRMLVGGNHAQPAVMRQMVQMLVKRFLRNAEMLGEFDLLPHGCGIRLKALPVEGKKDFLNVMRYIHLSPMSEMYILSFADYYWTSYQDYQSHPRFDVVDEAVLLRVLSIRDVRAQSTLAEFHRRGVVMRNQIPEIIAGGEYSLLNKPQEILNDSILESAVPL